MGFSPSVYIPIDTNSYKKERMFLHPFFLSECCSQIPDIVLSESDYQFVTGYVICANLTPSLLTYPSS